MAKLNNGGIVVIGPVLPFRGGIAQHTTLLARELGQSQECRILSFSRLYPRWLFPGSSSYDPGYEHHVEPNTEYLLDSINPRTWRRALERVHELAPTLVFIPWWTFFLGPAYAYLGWSLRRRGIDVVFLCHNVLDHEKAAWKRYLTRLALRHGSRFVTQTRTEAHRIEQIVPGASIAIQPHPIYDQFPAPTRRLRRRAMRELLFYGFVRPYKGLDLLIEAFAKLYDMDIFLTIAGEFWSGETEIRRRIAELGLLSRVEIIAHYVSDQETAELFSRCDLVVLPYRSASSSGVIPLAYHFGRPVIATRVGGLPDVVADGKTGYLVNPYDVEGLADAIRHAGDLIDENTLTEIEQFKKMLTWKRLAEVIISDGST